MKQKTSPRDDSQINLPGIRRKTRGVNSKSKGKKIYKCFLKIVFRFMQGGLYCRNFFTYIGNRFVRVKRSAKASFSLKEKNIKIRYEMSKS